MQAGAVESHVKFLCSVIGSYAPTAVDEGSRSGTGSVKKQVNSKTTKNGADKDESSDDDSEGEEEEDGEDTHGKIKSIKWIRMHSICDSFLMTLRVIDHLARCF